MNILEIKQDLYWIGVKDPDLKIFDIIVETKYGSTYNAYLLRGSDKTILVDTVKLEFLDEFVTKVEELIPFQKIDYIIVNHTEPDHAGSIQRMVELNPNVTLVGSVTALKFLKEIVNCEFKELAVKENDTLSLGDKTLQFMITPNLHWPDTMMTYWVEGKVLFSCDFFGAHYCPRELKLSDLTAQERENHMEAYKHYYDCIMGPFTSFVVKGINRLRDVDYEMICNGHGPILDQDLERFYQAYESYTKVAKNKIPLLAIPYVSSYGYTRTLAHKIAEGAKLAGVEDVRLFDMVEEKPEDVMLVLDHADGILFGSPTILGDALKPIWDLATTMLPATHSGKLASAFGSYGWTGEAVPFLIERLKSLRMKVVEGLRVKFKPSAEEELQAIEFGKVFGQLLLEKHGKES